MINFDIFSHSPFFFLVSCFSRSAGDGCMVAHWPYWTRTDNRSSWLMQLGNPKPRGALPFQIQVKLRDCPFLTVAQVGRRVVQYLTITTHTSVLCR